MDSSSSTCDGSKVPPVANRRIHMVPSASSAEVPRVAPPGDAASPRTSLRAAQKALTRTRLLDAATSAFESRGYVDVTVDDIVHDAGVSRGTFYSHFPSKYAILCEATRETEVRI